MNVAFTLQKDTKLFFTTAFPKVIGEFRGENIYAYSNYPTLLEEKILLLKDVDFHLSNDNQLITSMKHHPDKQISQDVPLKVREDTEIPDQELLKADNN